MKIKTTRCIECRAEKEAVVLTGSFLCDGCQEEQFDDLRNKYGEREKLNKKSLVESLMIRGYVAKDILRKTKMNAGTMYHYMTLIRKKYRERGETI